MNRIGPFGGAARRGSHGGAPGEQITMRSGGTPRRLTISPAVKREIAQPPLAGRVEHLGYIASDRRYDLYTRASMLVLPSHLEGFGLPVLEAMTAGIPVIVSNRGALPEVAGDAGQIVEPDDPEGFAEAMRRYLDEPAFAAAAVARGLARARTYSWDASARTLLAAYRSLRPLDGARGRPERVEGR